MMENILAPESALRCRGCYIWINNEPLGTRFNPTRGKLPDHLIRTTTNNTAQPRRGGPLYCLST